MYYRIASVEQIGSRVLQVSVDADAGTVYRNGLRYLVLDADGNITQADTEVASVLLDSHSEWMANERLMAARKLAAEPNVQRA